MASVSAIHKVAQAWCTPETEKIPMDVVLGEAFANILDEVWGKPWLGNATTSELLDELRARCEINGTLHYKTTGEN